MSLAVMDALGCTDTLTRVDLIKINGPFATAVVDDTVGYVDFNVNFNSLDKTLTDSILWTPGDGTVSNYDIDAPYNYTYTIPGEYRANFRLKDTLGCEWSPPVSPLTVYALPCPTLDIGSDIDLCLSSGGLDLNAYNSSHDTTFPFPISTDVNYEWFVDGAIQGDTDSVFTITPSSGNREIVSRIYILDNAVEVCIRFDTVQINYRDNPVADFDIANACEDASATFTDNSSVAGGTSLTNWNWAFGDGDTETITNPPSPNGNTSHIYDDQGRYNATLIVNAANGCADTITKEAIAFPKADLSVIAPPVCQGTDADFASTSTIDTLAGSTITGYAWDVDGDGFDDGIDSVLTFNFGTFFGDTAVRLQVTSSFGCVEFLTQRINIHPNPVPAFTFTDSICLGFPTPFDASTSTVNNTLGGTIIEYAWDFDGDGTDETTTASATTNFTFPTEGTLNTILTVTSRGADGTLCSASISQMVTVLTNSGASYMFAPNPACEGDTIIFDASATAIPIPPVTIIGYDWDFENDGTFDFENNAIYDSTGLDGTTYITPTYLYPDAGIYNALLRVRSSNSCVDTAMREIIIHPNPIPNFDITEGCSGVEILFTSTSDLDSIGSNVQDSITFYEWNFGDGSPVVSGSMQTTALHTYSDSGNYEVKLRVISNGSCEDSIVRTVRIFPSPDAEFSVANDCADSLFVFDASATQKIISAVGDTVVSYQWDFDGNGTVDSVTTIDNTNFVYPTAGTFQAILEVFTNNGCSNRDTVEVVVFPNPVPNFTFTDNCADSLITFTSTSTISSGNITDFAWDFDNDSDFTDANGNPATTTFPLGDYIINLQVTSDSGCVAVATDTITVFPNPTANFNADAACLGFPTTFTDATTIGGTDTIATYIWDFQNDGIVDLTTTTAGTVYQYANAGDSTVSLTVISQSGCSSTITKVVNIQDNADAQFTVNAGCTNDDVIFTDATIAPQITGSITRYFIDYFNDGSDVDTVVAPPVPFNPISKNYTPGTYTARLITLTDNNCIDTASRTFTVNPLPVVTISGDDAFCVGAGSANVRFQLTTGTLPYEVYFQRNGVLDSLEVFTTNDTTINQAVSDTVIYTLVSARDANGCLNTLTDTVNVFVHALPQANLSGGEDLCLGNFANVNIDFTSGNAPYNIEISDGVGNVVASLTGVFSDTTIRFSPTDTITYNITALSDVNGCARLGGFGTPTTFNVRPLPNGVLTGTTTICNGASVDLTLDFDNIGTPNFFVQIERVSASLTDTISLNNQADLATVSVTPTETTTYRLILVRDANGCERVTNSAVTVAVNQLPTASFTFTDEVCFGFPTPFESNSTTGTGAINSFAWDFDNDGTADDTNNPTTFTFPTFGTFPVKLTVGDGNTCTDDTVINVTVVPNAVANFSVSPACELATVTFTNEVDLAPLAGTGVTITSYQWDFENDGTFDVTRATKQDETFTYDLGGITSDVTVTALLRVETSNGCFDTLTVPFLIRPNPIVTISGADEYCVGTENSDITFSLTVGDFPYTVRFERNGVLDSVQVFTSADTTFTETLSDTTIYKLVSVSDANSCSNSALSDSIEIQVHELPVANLSGGTDLCAGDIANVNISFVGGNAPYNITIGNSLDGTLVNLPSVLSDTTIQFTVSDTITYNITSLSDANTCDAIDLGTPTTFIVNPLPVVTIANAGNFCVGADSARVTFTLTTGDSPFKVLFRRNGVLDSLENLTSPFTLVEARADTTLYELVSVTDANGCTNTITGSTEVQVHELPIANLSGGATLCVGETANVTIDFVGGNFPYDIEISDGANAVVANLTGIFSDTTIQFTPTDTITYKITALSDANSCDAIDFGDSTTFIVNPLPVATIASAGDFCFGTDQAEITFTLTTGDSPFQKIVFARNGVSDSVQNVASPVVLTEAISDTTVYSLISVTDNNGCSNTFTDSVEVNVNKLPVADLSGGEDLCFGETANVEIDFDEEACLPDHSTLSSKTVWM